VRSLSPTVIERMHNLACQHEVYGYIFERMWLHLLGDPFLLPCVARHEQASILLERAVACT
jgi:hypothetical protein